MEMVSAAKQAEANFVNPEDNPGFTWGHDEELAGTSRVWRLVPYQLVLS